MDCCENESKSKYNVVNFEFSCDVLIFFDFVGHKMGFHFVLNPENLMDFPIKSK